jgi:hypothetical protein
MKPRIYILGKTRWIIDKAGYYYCKEIDEYLVETILLMYGAKPEPEIKPPSTFDFDNNNSFYLADWARQITQKVNRLQENSYDK